MSIQAPDYAEIGITTNFSFLRGGSDPRAYVHQASQLRLPVIGIADHNSLAGVVRAYKELDNPELKHIPKLLIGSGFSNSRSGRNGGSLATRSGHAACIAALR